jgi:RimJ/RimL family protein N-acetyltransferase
MPSPVWPLFDLNLSTARLTLRTPTDDDFAGLLDAEDAGIHDSDAMPFSTPWTDAEPPMRRRTSAQFWWGQRAGWSREEWHLPFAVFLDGQPVGIQELFAKRFLVLREVATGSWLTRSVQGQGLGKEMRLAVLQLAFEELGAEVARSGAFVDNLASISVSRSIGYRDNGRHREAPRGEPREMINFEITREEWMARRSGFERAEIVGLEGCLYMFGANIDGD